MIERQNLEKIKEIVQEFFEKTSFDINAEILVSEDDKVSVKVRTEDPKILIGQNGQTLSEIQHLLRVILRHNIDTPFFLEVDINDYKEKKIGYLKETARALADEVALNKEEKTLLPMSSYERRVIHLELADREDVKTESIGEGSDRKITIIPC